jgi:glycosyltransferase involved in cell wall biosynthesis
VVQKKWVVMINDCGYDGLNIVRELRKDKFPIVYIPRTRKLMDKILRIGSKILRAKGALYHVNYALQDAFITILTKKIIGKKPVIVHCRGSDLRWETDLTQKPLQAMVWFNVKNADQVFVADLDTLKRAKELNPTAIWMPITIDLDIFSPKGISSGDNKFLKILYPNFISESVRGSLTFFKAFNKFAKDYKNVLLDAVKLGPELNYAIELCRKAGTLNNIIKFQPPIPHEQMIEEYLSHDITVGVFKSGIIPTVGLESWAVKRPFLNYINPKLYPPFDYISARTEDEIIEGLYQLTDEKTRIHLANAGYQYVRRYHDVRRVVKRIKKVYESLI